MEPATIKNIIEEVLIKLTAEYDDIEIIESKPNQTTRFMVHSSNPGLLIGNNGDNLWALDYIVRQIIRKALGYTEVVRFILDINSYLSSKDAEIVATAVRAAERAKLFKRDIELSPMSPYERMIIHAYLADDPMVVTQSEGNDKFRRVVVKYIQNNQIV